MITLDGVFQRMVKVNNLERNEFDRMMAMNPYGLYNNGQGGSVYASSNRVNQLDQLSINQISAKHMDYNQMMIALGKGRKVDIGDHFKKLNELKHASANKDPGSVVESALLAEQLDKERHRRKKAPSAKEQQAPAQEKELSSLLNQAGKVNKSNLPIAMQYRSSLQNPKRVEVGQSKIHRIGLFTQENLKPKDIVIEYVGEIIRNQVADNREKRYEETGIGDCYMFRLDEN